MTKFRKHASGAVDAASTHGWMNEVYEAMGVAPTYQKGNSRESYSKDEIRSVYKKYRTLSEFKSKHKSYYSDALKLGMQKKLIENLVVKFPKFLY